MTYGIKELCERYGVGEHTVLGWIHAGELEAFSVARKQSGRPKWRVTLEALERFEQSRAAAPPKPVRRRRKKQTAEVRYY